MLKKLKSINFFLLIGAILLLFPLMTHVIMLFMKQGENSALVRWFFAYTPIYRPDNFWLYIHQNPQYRSEAYFNIAYYLAAIILAVVLFVHNYGKEINRIICVTAAVVLLLHLVPMVCEGVLILKKPYYEFKLFMMHNALLIGLAGYLFIFAGLIKVWLKPKQKHSEVAAVQ